jgi:antitoxin component YwqK of YwqJK toxin-antitoxin module
MVLKVVAKLFQNAYVCIPRKCIMYKLLKIILCLIPLSSIAQEDSVLLNGYQKYYYDNGKISSEGFIRNGKPDGYWKTYSKTGVLKSEGNRKNFELDSLWKFYNEQGKIAFEFNYLEGKKNGLKNTYNTKEGYLIQSENYINDIKEKNTFVFYKDGKIKQTIPFVAGKEEGIGYEYSADSTIITITQYKMGFVEKEERINRKDDKGLKQGMWKTFYTSGVVKNEINFTDDKMNGYLKEYSTNGSLLNTTKYVNGVIQKNAPELAKLDVKNAYYNNGALKYTATYKDGVEEGIQREFSPEGTIIGAKIFSEGLLIGEGILDTAGQKQGPWKEYHLTGELKSEGAYLNGKRIGEWIFYYPNKNIEQTGKYDKKGLAQGPWKWYYEDGKILREENYRNDLQDGVMTEYSEDGKIITKGEYIDGLKEGAWILELPDYREEGSYQAGKRTGEWKHYYTSNNRLRFTGKFIDGIPDGMQIFYYPNGREKQTGKYVGGLKEGYWNFYDEDGFLFLTILFKNDIEIKFDGIKVVPESSPS